MKKIKVQSDSNQILHRISYAVGDFVYEQQYPQGVVRIYRKSNAMRTNLTDVTTVFIDEKEAYCEVTIVTVKASTGLLNFSAQDKTDIEQEVADVLKDITVKV